jgi:hypothetical protein
MVGGGLVNEDAPAGPGALAGKPPCRLLERHHSCRLPHPPPITTRQLAPYFFSSRLFFFSLWRLLSTEALPPMFCGIHPPHPLTQAEEKKSVAMAQHEILTHFRGYGFSLTNNRAAHVGH